MQNCIDALHPFGDVLQVGFGSEAYAQAIQKFHPRSHLLLVYPAHEEKARKWVAKHSSVKLLESSWRAALPELGIFDSIFFEAGDPFETFQEGKSLIESAEAEMARLPKMRYTETELDGFCESVPSSSKSYLYQFLRELEENGQISSEMKKKMISKYHLKRKEEKKRPPLALPFLLECLKGHMRKGSRFATIAPIEEEPGFIEEIGANPELEVETIEGFLIIEKII